MTTDDFERSISYGEAAIAYLKANATPAYPRNYELWYTYAAGFNRELNKAINDYLKRSGRVGPEMTERFYEEFLSPVRLGDRVGEVSTQVSTEIGGILDLLESTGENVEGYGASLSKAASHLARADTQVQVREIVERMMAATGEMQSKNKQLEDQLKDSRHQIKELQESLEAIRYESMTDQLTGLANRKHFDQSLDRACAAAQRRGEPLSLVMCDIDHFKEFNDTYGHQTGDQVLRLVGAAIKSAVKGRDIAARYGGEEFGIILPNSTLEAGVTVAEEIRRAVMAKELIKRSTGESLGRITMSCGVAAFRENERPESLIERADACLYASKRNGRNKVTDETHPTVEPRHSAVA